MQHKQLVALKKPIRIKMCWNNCLVCNNFHRQLRTDELPEKDCTKNTVSLPLGLIIGLHKSVQILNRLDVCGN